MFIKKLDQYLLKNYPVTWSSRIHTAGVYGTCFSLLVALLSFIAPNDPRNNSTIHYWIVLISIISLLAFICWMIYLLRFNVFKRYGTWKNTDTVKSFLFYFIITLIIISWPFIPPVIESIKANFAYTSEELAADINGMNIKICQLEQNSIDKRFRRDTFQVDNSVVRYERRNVVYSTNETEVADISSADNYYFIDTATLRGKLNMADSVKKLSDSIYVIYECPDYRFIYQYSIGSYSKIKLLSSMDLYRQVLQYKQVVDKENLRKELGQLFIKYSPHHDPISLSAGERTYNSYGESSYISKIRDKYDLHLVNQQIDNITDKKYRWDTGTIEICWRLVYYFTLCLSMLVLIYRHTTRRTFFLSLLAAVVLTIVTGLFIAMSSSGENAFFIWIISYFVLFILLSAFIFTGRNRNAILGIALNLLVFMTPFMPLVITSLYYESLRNKYRYDNNWIQYGRLFENERIHSFLSEI
ncbi:MAG TPA: hypothetical protein VKB95_14600, partial [Chitinophagaceae bacterium]|nr:hypothetical protein [Chitinophagaceae bacterium]